MHSRVDMLQQLDSIYDILVLELIITIVFPNPVATQFLDF
jgi:hypothetical protein